MKKLILILSLSILSISVNAQFKIQEKVFVKAFSADTVISMSISVISLAVMPETIVQKPVFILSLKDKLGNTIESREVAYQDLKNACTKNGIPENQHDTVIANVLAAVFCGTKTQKLAAIRNLIDAYGIVLKPDSEQ